VKRKTKAQRARRIKKKTAQNLAAREQGQAAADEAAVPILKSARHISQLQLLLSRGNITDRQYKAGDQLYRNWRASGSEPRLAPSYMREVGLGLGGTIEYQIGARRRFEQAMLALKPEQRSIAFHVCLMDQRLALWTGLMVPISEAMKLLRETLDDLEHWNENRRAKKPIDTAKSVMVAV
jgi:hypothetical protein